MHSPPRSSGYRTSGTAPFPSTSSSIVSRLSGSGGGGGGESGGLCSSIGSVVEAGGLGLGSTGPHIDLQHSSPTPTLVGPGPHYPFPPALLCVTSMTDAAGDTTAISGSSPGTGVANGASGASGDLSDCSIEGLGHLPTDALGLAPAMLPASGWTQFHTHSVASTVSSGSTSALAVPAALPVAGHASPMHPTGHQTGFTPSSGHLGSTQTQLSLPPPPALPPPQVALRQQQQQPQQYQMQQMNRNNPNLQHPAPGPNMLTCYPGQASLWASTVTSPPPPQPKPPPQPPPPPPPQHPQVSSPPVSSSGLPTPVVTCSSIGNAGQVHL
ncbi:unnamed protein product [Protopolystoma xenopodis]|uniref:Uncharacterized protein n=1 Tax=Protopolystoma xenopodis TaxID=117903 RepID=A0A448WRZ0_9PLAT|nr:unnamed protein product [Protopolystoma xenopodis]